MYSFIHTHTHNITHTHALSLSLSHTHTHTHTLSHTLSLSLSLSLSHTHTQTHRDYLTCVSADDSDVALRHCDQFHSAVMWWAYDTTTVAVTVNVGYVRNALSLKQC